MKVKTNIAFNLKKLRGAFLAQRTVANFLHVKRSTYAAWEEERAEPSLCYLLKLSEFHKVTIEQLLTELPNTPQ